MLNTINAEDHDSLPMAKRSLIALPPFLLENDSFIALGLLFDRCIHSSILDLGTANGGVVC